jgi:hypothetical protein
VLYSDLLMRPGPEQARRRLTNPEFLGRNIDFQRQYTAVLDELGKENVHTRNPSEPRDILCMDEGLMPKSKVTVRLAGPVPLLARTSPILRAKAAEGIVYGSVFDHDKCGALGLNLKALGEGIDIDPNKAGAVFAGRFAKDLTQEYEDHQVEYGGRLALTRRPENKHTGQIVYYDGRQSGMDLAHVPAFSPGYTVSRGLFGPDASREYTELALSIAFGDGGLGTALTPENPMHVVGIADSQQDIGQLHDELKFIQRARGQDAERVQLHIISALH